MRMFFPVMFCITDSNIDSHPGALSTRDSLERSGENDDDESPTEARNESDRERFFLSRAASPRHGFRIPEDCTESSSDGRAFLFLQRRRRRVVTDHRWKGHRKGGMIDHLEDTIEI